MLERSLIPDGIDSSIQEVSTPDPISCHLRGYREQIGVLTVSFKHRTQLHRKSRVPENIQGTKKEPALFPPVWFRTHQRKHVDGVPVEGSLKAGDIALTPILEKDTSVPIAEVNTTTPSEFIL